MVKIWKLRYGGEVMDGGNRKHVRRNTINHFVHHRAQTTVYLAAQRAIKRKDDADASAAVDSQTDSVGAIAGRLHATCRRFVNFRWGTVSGTLAAFLRAVFGKTAGESRKATVFLTVEGRSRSVASQYWTGPRRSRNCASSSRADIARGRLTRDSTTTASSSAKVDVGDALT
jgi:hypothetical protein